MLRYRQCSYSCMKNLTGNLKMLFKQCKVFKVQERLKKQSIDLEKEERKKKVFFVKTCKRKLPAKNQGRANKYTKRKIENHVRLVVFSCF